MFYYFSNLFSLCKKVLSAQLRAERPCWTHIKSKTFNASVGSTAGDLAVVATSSLSLRVVGFAPNQSGNGEFAALGVATLRWMLVFLFSILFISFFKKGGGSSYAVSVQVEFFLAGRIAIRSMIAILLLGKHNGRHSSNADSTGDEKGEELHL